MVVLQCICSTCPMLICLLPWKEDHAALGGGKKFSLLPLAAPCRRHAKDNERRNLLQAHCCTDDAANSLIVCRRIRRRWLASRCACAAAQAVAVTLFEENMEAAMCVTFVPVHHGVVQEGRENFGFCICRTCEGRCCSRNKFISWGDLMHVGRSHSKLWSFSDGPIDSPLGTYMYSSQAISRRCTVEWVYSTAASLQNALERLKVQRKMHRGRKGAQRRRLCQPEAIIRLYPGA